MPPVGCSPQRQQHRRRRQLPLCRCATCCAGLPAVGSGGKAFEEVFHSQVLVAMRHLFLLFRHLELAGAGLAVQGGIGGAAGIGHNRTALSQPGQAVGPALSFLRLRGEQGWQQERSEGVG